MFVGDRDYTYIFLIHDDIIDKDHLRRNQPTMHIKYAEGGDSHFGVSKALDLGDIGVFMAYDLLFSLNVDSIIKENINLLMNRTFLEVGYGQMLDIEYEKQKKFTAGNVMKIHRYKTADYTISGPLIFGAILAGMRDVQKLGVLKKFGIPIGIAFQLRDDELGLFSTEKVLGKPVDSDIKEGKVTLLIVKALKNASLEDRKFLKYAHGNRKLTNSDVRKVRDIVTKTGALKESKKISRQLVEEGKNFIPKITSDKKYQKMLADLADYMIERQS